MRRNETDKPAPGADYVGAGVTGIVEAGLRVLEDIHRRHVRRGVVFLVQRDRQTRPIDVLAQLFDFFHRPGFDVLESAWWLTQAVSERAQVLLRLDTQSPGL